MKRSDKILLSITLLFTLSACTKSAENDPKIFSSQFEGASAGDAPVPDDEITEDCDDEVAPPEQTAGNVTVCVYVNNEPLSNVDIGGVVKTETDGCATKFYQFGTYQALLSHPQFGTKWETIEHLEDGSKTEFRYLIALLPPPPPPPPRDPELSPAKICIILDGRPLSEVSIGGVMTTGVDGCAEILYKPGTYYVEFRHPTLGSKFETIEHLATGTNKTFSYTSIITPPPDEEPLATVCVFINDRPISGVNVSNVLTTGEDGCGSVRYRLGTYQIQLSHPTYGTRYETVTHDRDGSRFVFRY